MINRKEGVLQEPRCRIWEQSSFNFVKNPFGSVIQERRIYNPADEAWKLMTLNDPGYLMKWYLSIYIVFVCPWLYCPQLPRVWTCGTKSSATVTDWLSRFWDKRDVCSKVVTRIWPLEFARSTCVSREFFQLTLFFSASLLRAQSTFHISAWVITDRSHVWGSVHFCCYSLRSLCWWRCQIQTFLLYS